MSSNLKAIISKDLEQRFGSDISSRILGKELVKSISDFYGNEEAYLAHTKGLSTFDPNWLSSTTGAGDLNFSDLSTQLKVALDSDQPILIMVGDAPEMDSANISARKVQEFLSSQGKDVSIEVISKDDSYKTAKGFIKKNGQDGNTANLIGFGVGYDKDLVGASLKDLGSVNQMFIDDAPFLESDDMGSAYNIKREQGDVGYSFTLQAMISNALDGEELELWGMSQSNEHVTNLAKYEHQSNRLEAPIALRGDSLDELTKYSSLNNSFKFNRSLGWVLGLKGAMNYATESKVIDVLSDAGVDADLFEKSTRDIIAQNISTNLTLEILAAYKADGQPIEVNAKGENVLRSFASVLAEVTANTVDDEAKLTHLSKSNALEDLRSAIVELETSPHLSDFEKGALKSLKTTGIKLSSSVRELKGVLRDSDVTEVIRDEGSSVQLTKFKHGASQVINEQFLKSLYPSVEDGISISYNESPEASKRIMLDTSMSFGARKELIDNKLAFSMGGLNVEQPYGGDLSILQLTSTLRNGSVDDNSVRRFARNADSINQARLKSKASDNPVIVVEPDSIGDALSVLNYVGAGHSNGVDPKINLRIPKSTALLVTDKETGGRAYMTISEIMESGLSNFSSFEVLYSSANPAEAATPKKLNLDAETIKMMAQDVGSKRSYGPITLGYSADGISGRVFAKSYDPSFKIRYKKDVVLKGSKSRHRVSNKFWADMKRKGNVDRDIPEEMFKNINGVDLNAKGNFKVFKSNILNMIDNLNDGFPAKAGDSAFWCVDTETTGINADSDLLNFGAVAYSVEEGTGVEVDKMRVITTLDGQAYVLRDNSEISLIGEEDKLDDLANSEVMSVGEAGESKLYKINPKTLTQVDNVSNMDLDGDTVIINRRIKADYISSLVKTDEFTKVHDVIEELSGVSTEQIEKYGVTIPELEKIFLDETSKFKAGNAFAIHNSDFDVKVMGRQSKSILDELTSNNNVIVDTRKVAESGESPLLYNEATEQIAIESSNGKQVATFASKDELLEFLKTAEKGDVLEGLQGTVKISARGLLQVSNKHGGSTFATANGYNKLEDRTDETLMDFIKSRKVLEMPSIGGMKFESHSALSSFLGEAVDGSRLSGAFDSGYIEFVDGELVSYDKGVARAAKVINQPDGTDLAELISMTRVGSVEIKAKMELMMGQQKISDLIKTTLPVEVPSLGELKAEFGLSNESTAQLAVFAGMYDLSKSVESNIANFSEAHDIQIEADLLTMLGGKISSDNRLSVFAHKNKDSLCKAVKLADKVKGKVTQDVLDKLTRDAAVHKDVAKLAINMVSRYKKSQKVSRVWLDQSHCNAERHNSDVFTELMVATTMMNAAHGNSYSSAKSLQSNAKLISDASIDAGLRADRIKNGTLLVQSGKSESALFTQGARAHSQSRSKQHDLKKEIKLPIGKSVVELKVDRFDHFTAPSDINDSLNDMAIAVAGRKLASVGAASRSIDAKAMAPHFVGTALGDLTSAAEKRLVDAGIEIASIDTKDKLRAEVKSILDKVRVAVEANDTSVLTKLKSSKVVAASPEFVRVGVINSIDTMASSARIGGQANEDCVLPALEKALTEVIDSVGSAEQTEGDDLLLSGINDDEAHALNALLFESDSVKSKLSLLRPSEVEEIQQRNAQSVLKATNNKVVGLKV
ncbi:hypothetical protein VCHA53O466_50127 [Vibrio chagasii]|nr:hypothetical protein VCHA53O466_50127 [Vibrio chagasii]